MEITLAIIGTGLMGGSIGLAARSRGMAGRVVGFDIDEAALRAAASRGAVSETASDAAQAVEGADVVIIATPIGTIVEVFSGIAPSLSSGAIVTDVGSIKERIVSEIAPRVSAGIHFIGGHPIAGSEQQGVEAADRALYEGASWILTPTDGTDPEAYGRLVRFVSGLGAKVLALPPRRHDHLVALTSHLPQLLASVLMGSAGDITVTEGGVPLAAGGGFRDMTRVAASSPEMWAAILSENRTSVLDAIDRFQESLGHTRKVLADGDRQAILEFLTVAHNARRSLPEKAGMTAEDLREVDVAVTDDPGSLAEIATTLGEGGINIEDLRIVHSPEGGRGMLRIQVDGPSAAGRAVESLRARGYRATTVEGAR